MKRAAIGLLALLAVASGATGIVAGVSAQRIDPEAQQTSAAPDEESPEADDQSPAAETNQAAPRAKASAMQQLTSRTYVQCVTQKHSCGCNDKQPLRAPCYCPDGFDDKGNQLYENGIYARVHSCPIPR